MAQNTTISIAYKIEGVAGGFKKLTVDAEAFRKLMEANVSEVEKLKKSVINFAALATSIDSVSNTLSSMQGVLKDLSSAYATQHEAETQLAVNMRNTMNAREEDIQSIKDFCSAQQEIGIVGDEVQLAGAQEMATYLEEKASLEKLIPVMNDMVAQQYGYNHSAENAVTIATMLGKVMQGQTTALSRLGYSFDEVQEEILKAGTEMERAAVLADVISQSVGGMNAELAKTDTGKLKQLENNLGDIKEQLGELAQSVMPWVTMAANATTAAGGVLKLVAAVKALSGACLTGVRNLKAFWLATSTLSAGSTGFVKSIATCRLFIAQFCTALTQGTKGLRLFATAWRGMLISTGIGVAIAAVTAVIAYFTLKTDEATESTDKFLEAEERAKREAEELNRIREEENSLRNNTNALLKVNIAKLENFNGTKAQEKKLVDEMNSTYGETMGYFASVASWYDALIANSEAYCRQMVLETRTRKLANLIEEKEQSRMALQKSIDNGEFSTQRETREKTRASANSYYQTGAVREEIIGTSEQEKALKRVEEIDSELTDLNTQLKNAAEEAVSLEFNVKGSVTPPATVGNSSGTTTKEKTRLQEINELIAKSKEEYISASEERREEIRKNIQELEKEKGAIERLYAEAERPASLSSLAEIDKEISHQRSLRQKASAENIAAIDAEIYRLEDLKEEIEDASYIPVPVDQITTYRQLNRELSYYNSLLEKADGTQRAAIQEEINKRNELKKTWDRQLEEVNKPGDISTLDTITKLDEAISYYQMRQKDVSEDEVQQIQKTIDAYERKRTAFQRSIEIPSMIREADEINKLTGKEYKLKIRGMGFDELTQKIRELQKMLNDTENPVTDSQRKDIEGLIGTYEKWRKEGIDSFDTFRDGWGSLKGISGTIEGLTDTLTGDANAWQKLTAIVDGFIQLFEGVKAIVGIINMLTMATQQHTVAKETEAAATATETAETIAQTSATVADTSATLANTAAKSGEAVAEATSSGAKMPFPLNIVAIAAGVAAVVGALAVVGKFADGGIVGGNSPTGDKLLARVNTGEMILNKKQQTNLFEFIKSGGGNLQQLGIPKFAEGGIVSGPTLGLVGEYAGAKNNPEVIAPLNKLRDLIGNDENGANGRVEFEIRGDRLWGILRKFERNKSRT